MKNNFMFGFFLILTLFACSKGTRIGNPPSQISEVQFKLTGTLPATSQISAMATSDLSVVGASGNSLGILAPEKALVGLKSIKFLRTETSLDDDSVDIEGPFVVNLLTGVVVPEIPTVTLDLGAYRGVKLKMAKDETGELAGRSFLFEGNYTGQTASGLVSNIPTTVALELEEEFEMLTNGANPLNLESNSLSIVAAFRLARWFNFSNSTLNPNLVDFSSLSLNGGALSLDPAIQLTQNEERVLETLKETVKKSADLGLDLNGDGVLGSNEDLDGLENEDESEWD